MAHMASLVSSPPSPPHRGHAHTLWPSAPIPNQTWCGQIPPKLLLLDYPVWPRTPSQTIYFYQAWHSRGLRAKFYLGKGDSLLHTFKSKQISLSLGRAGSYLYLHLSKAVCLYKYFRQTSPGANSLLMPRCVGSWRIICQGLGMALQLIKLIFSDFHSLIPTLKVDYSPV